MDQVKTMRAFVEVARRGSFASAAKHLAISTSTASRLVMELEDLLDDKLDKFKFTKIGDLSHKL